MDLAAPRGRSHLTQAPERQLRKQLEEKKQSTKVEATLATVDIDFVIIRRRVQTMDNISLTSSSDSDKEMNCESGACCARKQKIDPKSGTAEDPSNTTPTPEHTSSNDSPPSLVKPTSPFESLDLEAHQLRLILLDMSPSESSSTEVVRHTVREVVRLLNRYGEVDGVVGITRCGDTL